MTDLSILKTQVWKSDAAVLRAKGADALDFLHRLSTQDLRGALGDDAKSVSTAFTTAQGKLVEWCRIYRVSAEEFLLVCHGSRGEQLREWIEKYIIIEEVEVSDVSNEFLTLECGAEAPDSELLEGTEVLRVSTPPGAMLRYEVLYPSSGPNLAGVEGLVSGNAESRELLRLIAGQPSPHLEYQKDTNPLELNLLHDAIGWNKGCYIGQEVISRMDSYDKVARGIIGFESTSAAELPAPGDKLVSVEGKTVGRVTSSATTSEGTCIGLALVGRQWSSGSEVKVLASSGEIQVRLVERSFGRKP